LESWDKKKEMPELTLKAFEGLIEDAFKVRAEIDSEEAALDIKKAFLKAKQDIILGYMVEFKKDSYKTQFGQIIKKKNWSVATPKTPEDRAAFFDYLKQKGIFDEMVTVHSKTLNSFVSQELEAAKESGDIDFKVPGIGEPKIFESIAMKK
jgi:hypothetical protein